MSTTITTRGGQTHQLPSDLYQYTGGKTNATNVPAKACRFAAGACQFAEPADDDRTVPIAMLARSGDPIDHWYWGRVVHDLSGMFSRDKVPIDWCHDEEQILGFLDQFSTSSGDLHAEGKLIPYVDDDKVAEIRHKAALGVPYEASIYFGGTGMKIEELGSGAEAEVNGRKLTGPLVIIRDWPLRGVAICPYGADQNTRSELALAQDDEEIPITVISGDTNMSHDVKLTAAQQAEIAAHEEKEAAEKLAAEKLAAEAGGQKAELARFRKAFGLDGVDWYLEGKSFEEARALFAQKLQVAAQSTIDQLQAKVGELESKLQESQKKLASLDLGADEPAAFIPGPDPKRDAPPQAASNVGDRLAALVALNQQAIAAQN